MPDAFATTDDLAARWKDLTDDETIRADVLLGDAAVWLRAWFPTLDARIQGGEVDAQAALIVSCAMVKRAMLGINNAGQESSNLSETMGPFMSQSQVKFRNPDGDLYVTGQEADLLDGRPSGAVSMECVGL